MYVDDLICVQELTERWVVVGMRRLGAPMVVRMAKSRPHGNFQLLYLFFTTPYQTCSYFVSTTKRALNMIIVVPIANVDGMCILPNAR